MTYTSSKPNFENLTELVVGLTEGQIRWWQKENNKFVFSIFRLFTCLSLVIIFIFVTHFLIAPHNSTFYSITVSLAGLLSRRMQYACKTWTSDYDDGHYNCLVVVEPQPQ